MHQHYRHIGPSDGAFVSICIWVLVRLGSNGIVTKQPWLLHIWSKLRPHTYEIIFKSLLHYSRTLSFWISIVFLKHTISFSEAPVRKILAGKKRYRSSRTELQSIFVLFALNLLSITSLVEQPDYGSYAGKSLCALQKVELEFTESLIPAKIFWWWWWFRILFCFSFCSNTF